MNHIKLSTFLFIGILMLSFSGCSNSDNENETSELIRTEVAVPNLENADVNSPTFWDNTELAWSDEFNGTSIESDKWYFESYLGSQGNTELQNYTDDNTEVSNGTLKIQAKKIGSGQKVGDYTSARMVSKFAFTYGKLEIRAKLPPEKGNGLWSKIWMLGNNIDTVGYPQCGELIFMTYASYNPGIVNATVHTGENFYGNGPVGTSLDYNLDTAEEEFHIYGLLWTPEYLKFYIDTTDNIYFTFTRPDTPNDTNWSFTKSFYFGMDMAVGGAVGGAKGVDDSIFPTTLEIDYIRVYHPE
ncbi:glycoside hydrolase family 16 protein [Zobellia uliginosa]|uniref:glycoside hydrolase family 16 protein n=1 Tax=Zobellia uliginosa TaxID=143224 RepID=UPI001C07EE53|nr:glycoside hydrolase family 16 protein [Zobellia uliginosa]MBU2947828.1 glycoside hydrolase family 16 protein [Zobellia uliginosa]